MEPDKIDKKFKELIEDSETSYAQEANSAYARIWNAVEKDEEKPIVAWQRWLAVAAAVVLFLMSSYMFVLNRHNMTEIGALKQEINQLNQLVDEQAVAIALKDKEIGNMASLHLDYQNQINLLVNSPAEREVVRDTVVVRQPVALAKLTEQPLHGMLAESKAIVIPESLKVPEEIEIIEDKETAKVQFIFADNHSSPNQKSKKPLVRVSIGKGRGNTNEAYSQTRPLSITKTLN